MSESKSNVEFSVEDIRFQPEILIPCGEGGIVAFPQNLEYKAPPPDSPYAGRMLLVTAKAGGIKVNISLKHHRVELKNIKTGEEKELLIRIPVGVRLFTVKGTEGLYYETAEGYDVIPLHFRKGTDPDQTMQELVLAVSPVPPRAAQSATQLSTLKELFKELTIQEIITRRVQDGLEPLAK